MTGPAKHTPGPWTWSFGALETQDSQYVLWPENVPGELADDAPWSLQLGACGVDAEENAEANARLIAAAPDLLAACEGLLWRFENDDEDLNSTGEEAPDIAALRAAIAKATGGAL